MKFWSFSFGGSKTVLLASLVLLCGTWQSRAEEQAQAPQPGQLEAPKAAQTPAPQASAAQAVQPEQKDDVSERAYTSDGVPSVALFYWMSPAQPKMRTGSGAIERTSANIDFPKKDWQSVPGVMLSLPGGGQHTVRISYFRTRGSGNTTAIDNTSVFGTGYSKGDYLSTGYTLHNAKLSLDYVSWPFPVTYKGFRLKTLWEVQFVSMRYVIDAPLNPTQDEDENILTTDVYGTNWFIYPSFGLGIEKFVSRNFRVEAKASGFALPNRPALVDAEAFGAYRKGQYEFVFGAKAFHFKTSPREEQFMRATLSGAFVGMRWYPKWQ
ncbi:MAG TPA: hypothetical protein VN442_08000 [Bryobacteraceae bacterium]|nr:hypothetical protein [Bryobacteraceae bacterium]